MCRFLCFSLLHFLFLLFPGISIDVGATNGVFLLFPNGFLLCDHGLEFNQAVGITRAMGSAETEGFGAARAVWAEG